MAFSLKNLFGFGSTFKPEKMGNTYFYPIDGLNLDKTTYLKQFLAVPELNNIINIRARAMASWRLEILSKATGLEVKANENLVKTLRKPNFFQSQVEFWRQSELFRSIYANEYLYFLTPVGMPNTVKSMFTLDPSKVDIEYKPIGHYFNDISGEDAKYFYTENGTKTELDKNNIIHLNDNRVIIDKDFLKGTSKFKALQPNIQNIIEAYEKRNILLKMPIGIMSQNTSDAIGQSMPMDPKEKENTLKDLARRGALPIISNLGVSYDSMTNNPKNMGLFEEVHEDTQKICDAFGVPYELLANQKGTTFANLKEAKKQMYEETIIPDTEEKTGALNARFAEKSWEIVGGFKHLAVFADDQKQRAISLKQLIEALSKALADGAITIEQYQNELKKLGI